MNRYFQSLRQDVAGCLIIISVIFCYGLSMPPNANSENPVAEELISLDIKNQPLGEVLEEISTETGYQFRMDERWNELPVTASLKNEPLHKGLKRILRNLNNAVIYGADGIISIKIYDRANSSGQSAVSRSYEETIHQPVASENQRSRSSGAQPRNLNRATPSVEQDPEENSESGPSVGEGVSESATDSAAADNE